MCEFCHCQYKPILGQPGRQRSNWVSYPGKIGHVTMSRMIPLACVRFISISLQSVLKLSPTLTSPLETYQDYRSRPSADESILDEKSLVDCQ